MPSENPSPLGGCPEREPSLIGSPIPSLLQRYRERMAQNNADRTHEATERPLAAVELGDIVKLHQPYRVGSKLYGQSGAVFTHGIVAEILQRLPDGRTRNVSLYLYSPATRQIYLGPNEMLEFVDHHCSEFTLYKRATEMGYLPTDPSAPPDDHER